MEAQRATDGRRFAHALVGVDRQRGEEHGLGQQRQAIGGGGRAALRLSAGSPGGSTISTGSLQAAGGSTADTAASGGGSGVVGQVAQAAAQAGRQAQVPKAAHASGETFIDLTDD